MNNNPFNPTNQPDSVGSGSNNEPPVQDDNANPAPVADNMAEQTTPIMSAPADAGQPMTVPVDTPAQPKKKSKIGKIIAICVAAVVLIGATVAGVMYMSWRNSDPVVLLDSVTNLFDTKAAVVTGDINMQFKEDFSEIKSIQLTSSDKTALIPSQSDSKLKVTLADDSVVELDVSTVIISDGSIYFKVDGIMDNLDSAEIPEEYVDVVEYFEEVIGKIDGQWIRISVKEIAESDLFASSDIDTDTYDCAINAVKNLNTDESRAELAELYGLHPFLKVDKRTDTVTDGYTDFNISGVRAELIDFLNSAQETPMFKEFTKCSEDFSGHTFTNGDFDSAESDIASTLTLGIDTKTRQIGRIAIAGQNDEYSLNMSIKITERLDSLDISAPVDSTSILDLLEDIAENISSLYSSYYYDYDYGYDLDDYGNDWL